jgi:hypothetical protein
MMSKKRLKRGRYNKHGDTVSNLTTPSAEKSIPHNGACWVSALIWATGFEITSPDFKRSRWSVHSKRSKQITVFVEIIR